MKKALIGIGAIVVVVGAVLAVALWLTNPARTFNKFAEAIETKNIGAAQALIGEDITEARKENIEFWIDDWASYEDAPTVIFESDVAWNERVKTDEAGNILKNKNGDRDKEIKPTPRYWSHLYAVYATVNFDETDEYEQYEDPMIFTLRRKSDAKWGMLGNIFRGWEVVRVRYQELDDEEYDDLFEEFELEDENLDLEGLEFELDEDGNVVTGAGDDATGEESGEAAAEAADDSGAGGLEEAADQETDGSEGDDSGNDGPAAGADDTGGDDTE